MKHSILLLFCLCTLLGLHAESVTYRIVAYNDDAGDFTLAAWGQKPAGSYVLFENDFGATRGNRYNQVPRGKQATLWLEGWEGCTIQRITLWMCSNNGSGTAALQVKAGEAELYSMSARAFDEAEWFGHWVSKDLQTYVAIPKEMQQFTPVPAEGEVAVTLKGGTAEGSVYLDAVTIDYQPAAGQTTESPLGWVFEKLAAKSTLASGDVVMLYRSGDAAGDIDGMDTSHYLDAIGLSSTASVSEPFVTFFCAEKTEDGHWTLTNGDGQQLGATGAQALAWDAGVQTWDISLGYDGATIASTNSKYGTLRYNAPAGSYPRFWNYTSKTLPLPYLYRRVRQCAPTQSTRIEMAGSRSIALSVQDTLVLHTALLPVQTTDREILWSSSDESVATVRSGIVFLHAAGQTVITATAHDGGATAVCHLTVTEQPAAIQAPPASSVSLHHPRISLDGRPAPSASRGVLIENQRKVLTHR